MGARIEANEPLLKSSQFRRERRQSWRDLEVLLAQAEKRGLRSLTTSELTRLPMLYRGAISSLSVARAISLDKALLEYLTNLTSRAYVLVYASKRRPGEAVLDFLSRGFPSTVLRYGGFVAASVGLMGLGVLSGYVMTTVDPERFYSLVPEGLAAGRNPAADTELLRETLYDDGESPIEALNAFAAYLFTHNSRVAIMSFALGFVGGAPSVALMFYNGLILGAMAAVFASRGLGSEFWAWVMPPRRSRTLRYLPLRRGRDGLRLRNTLSRQAYAPGERGPAGTRHGPDRPGGRDAAVPGGAARGLLPPAGQLRARALAGGRHDAPALELVRRRTRPGPAP